MYSQRPEEGSGSTGFQDHHELPHGCWELNHGLLEEEPVLLTAELVWDLSHHVESDLGLGGY